MGMPVLTDRLTNTLKMKVQVKMRERMHFKGVSSTVPQTNNNEAND
jgi:hypothetical protein